MNLLTLATEVGALAGYTVGGTGAQDVSNKARALRRINVIKSDIVSRYGGKWEANYREGWLPIVPLYSTGTADFINASRTVSGTSTVWTTAMKGYKILGPDGSYYKIASVTSATVLILSQPFQGTTVTLQAYQIWKDEYVLHPEVLTVGGFVDYYLPQVASEAWIRDMKASYPKESANNEPTTYSVIGKNKYSAVYSTGTVSGTVNTNTLTGVGTSWLANIEPGYEITIGAYTYHVLRINSDTEIELYQQLVVAPSAATYTSKGKNAVIVKFRSPTTQRIVHYWYWAKDYPLVNDNDEDWVLEAYPKVVINGVVYYDYMDKNDPIRTDRSSMAYENSIKDMKVAVDGAFTGPRVLGYYIPNVARE